MSTGAAAGTITVTAVVLFDDAGRVVSVRKRGTDVLIFPGGKPESGETPDQTGVREVREELGLELRPDDLELLGTWHTEAANEPGFALVSTVFRCLRVIDRDEVAVAAEIDELRWHSLDELPENLAPLSVQVLESLR